MLRNLGLLYFYFYAVVMSSKHSNDLVASEWCFCHMLQCGEKNQICCDCPEGSEDCTLCTGGLACNEKNKCKPAEASVGLCFNVWGAFFFFANVTIPACASIGFCITFSPTYAASITLRQLWHFMD